MYSLKTTDFSLNVDLLSTNDVEPLIVILNNCKFRSIKLQGNQTILQDSAKKE